MNKAWKTIILISIGVWQYMLKHLDNLQTMVDMFKSTWNLSLCNMSQGDPK